MSKDLPKTSKNLLNLETRKTRGFWMGLACLGNRSIQIPRRPFEELKMRKVGHPVSRPAMWQLRDVAVQPGQIVVKLGECIVKYSEQKEVSDFSSEIWRFHNSTFFFWPHWIPLAFNIV